MRPWFTLIAACATAGAACAAWAGQAVRAWHVPPGGEIVLGTYYEARHDPRQPGCTALRAPSVEILQNARRGTLTVRRPASAPITDVPHCPHLRAPAAVLVYRAATDAGGRQEDIAWRVTYQSARLGSRIFRGKVIIGR
jgi:hypothetical protein